MVIGRVEKVLARAQVTLGGFHAGVAEQELDLLQVSTALRRVWRTSYAVVGSDFREARRLRVEADKLLDGLVSHASAHNASALVDGPEQPAQVDARRFAPAVEADLHPGWNRNGADAPALADQVHDHPAAITLLDVFDGERRRFRPPQTTADQHCKNRPVSFTLGRGDIRGLQERLRLLEREPVARADSRRWLL